MTTSPQCNDVPDRVLAAVRSIPNQRQEEPMPVPDIPRRRTAPDDGWLASIVAADAARDPEWSATCGPYELRVAAKDGAR